MLYLISGLQASRVNLMQNDYAAGLPSPMAFLGLASVLSHEMGFDRYSAAVLPILHSVSVSEGRTRPELQATSGKRFGTVEIAEDLHGHVEFSFVISLPGAVDTQSLSHAMEGKRLAGGIIFNREHGKGIRVHSETQDGNVLRRAYRGRALIPGLRPDMMGHTSFGDPGTFSAVRDVLAVRKSEENPAPGFRVPVAIGYRMITLPGQNQIPKAARDDFTPHVFAEPGVGVAELVSVRNPSITNLDQAAFARLFWRWTSVGRHITCHPVYNPEVKEFP